MMLPSCGCSQFSFVVGIGPIFRRSMCVASLKSADQLFVVGDPRADQRGADLLEHLVLRTLHHGREGEHVFLLGDLVVGRRAVHDHRTQVRTTFLFDQSRAVGRRQVGDAVLLQVLLRSCPRPPCPCPGR